MGLAEAPAPTYAQAVAVLGRLGYLRFGAGAPGFRSPAPKSVLMDSILLRAIPRGSMVVPFWDYLIEFYI